ncbi:DUF551 domain-containing protein [Atlantibacter sp.]|uniref:DUF551 domain-containing protein n=1 Tax=Atlantibacter sp. TaxID=1903473 RepID=UPI0028B200D2|nr:DUF551 domain-containing protein [Atlantibacter sp.]
MTINEHVSDERIAHIRASYEASRKGYAFIGHPSYDESIAIIDELQQYRAAAEPVAWTDQNGLELLGLGMPVEVASKKCGEFYVALYAAPQVTSAPGKIDLLRAHYNYDGNDFEVRAYQRGWNDCVAAAPAVQAEHALQNFRAAMEGIGHIRRTLEETFGGLHGTHCEPDVLVECKAICDAIYAAYRKTGNPPVIPDDWIPVSERMPDTMISVLVTGDWFHHGVSFWDGASWCDLDFEPPVTHWMPLPAAPQQEAQEAKK